MSEKRLSEQIEDCYGRLSNLACMIFTTAFALRYTTDKRDAGTIGNGIDGLYEYANGICDTLDGLVRAAEDLENRVSDNIIPLSGETTERR